MRERQIFPFSAIVGQERMKHALLVNAINPRIGGVLIMGQRGSAKSTAARALANLLPLVRVPAGCPLVCDPEAPEVWCPACLARGDNGSLEERPTPFVSLPVGATQDRVVGTLDLEGAITEGKKRWEPGLLARAHRGLLYIDEVNLLPDHLVDLLLDVAAVGLNTVEREGISLTHPARFILIGTMNPDEGELRPQLLDRFGLCVEVDTIQDADLRAEVVSRTLAFESDPAKFWEQWAGAESRLRQQLLAARERLPRVRFPEGWARRISELCSKEHVEGLRADIIIQKTCLALASWDGREVVDDEDLDEAAMLALLHRRKPAPEPPPQARPPRKPSDSKGSGDSQPSSSTSESATGESSETPTAGGRQEQQPSEDGRPLALPKFEPDGGNRQVAKGRHRDRRTTQLCFGPTIGFTFPHEHPVRALALAATLRAAACRQAGGRWNGKGRLRLEVLPEDFRVPVRQGAVEYQYLFVVDASGSMAARRRMEATKGLLIGLLETAYRKRDRVALLIFAGTAPRLVLPPTRSARRAQRFLRDLPVGGRTPMASALQQARWIVARTTTITKELQQAVVVVSDGRSNVGPPGMDPLEAVAGEFMILSKTGVPVILLDAEEGPIRFGLMGLWAKRFGFVYEKLTDLQGSGGARWIRTDISKIA
jgi:magnesium chelatase subunit D